MKKLILLSIILIVGCATKSVSSSKPTEYSMGMGIEEFKEKNKGLELVEQKENDIVYLRKECPECNPIYYIFIDGELKASLPFWGGFDAIQF